MMHRIAMNVLSVLVTTTWLSGCATLRATGPGIDSFTRIRSPRAVSQAKDGTLYFIFDPDGISQLYRCPPGTAQRDAVKLTCFADGIGGFAPSDDDRWIVVSAAVGGNEQYDLHLLDIRSGDWSPVLVNPDVVYGSVVWRRDSGAFAYRANDESPADFHVYIYDLSSRTSKKVHSGEGHFAPVDFNRDGSKLMIHRFLSASHSQLFEVSLSSGERREITPEGEAWSFEPIGYTAAEDSFLVNSDYRGDLNRIHAIDLATRQVRPVLGSLGNREVDGGLLSEDRSLLTVKVNEDGYSVPYIFRTAGFTAAPSPQIPRGVIGGGSIRGTAQVFSVSNANTPDLAYRWDLSRPKEAPVALTSADTQGIDVTGFHLPEFIRYRSFDGMEIPAFLYLPADYRAGKRIPFIVYYHGGPEAQFRPSFMRAFQYFVSRGFGVIAPNVRGSSGYGKAYLEADNYRDRVKSVRDGVWAARYLVEHGYSTPKQIAAWGGSYGGYMVMAVITEAPELFGAACNVVGIVNFQTFLGQTKAYRRKLREAEYGPLDDPEFLKSISPIYKVDRITTPLLIAHGLNDPRVPVGEAMQVAVALKKKGLPVEELYFPDEGHGFAKEENRLLYYQELARFLETHLQ